MIVTPGRLRAGKAVSNTPSSPLGSRFRTVWRVFERRRPNRKVRLTSGLILSQNAFLISASQKVRVRLSFERGDDDQTDKGRSPSRAGEAATSAGRAEGRASAIIRCRRPYVETDADRLCPCVDRRPEPCLTARRTD